MVDRDALKIIALGGERTEMACAEKPKIGVRGE